MWGHLDTRESTTDLSAPEPLTGGVHHVAVQTGDMDTSIAWYRDFLGCDVTWSMSGGFSALSRRRLPGLSRVAELAVADMRFHLFTRASGTVPPPADANQFQHVCLRVPSADQLNRWRTRWIQLYESGRFRFTRPEPASEIDIDADGMQSFYAFDVNGLEFEFTYLPDTADDLG